MKDYSAVIHPIVLLSAVDHYRRMGTKRVVGVLLGMELDELHITNSFAVPFDEDVQGWSLDTSYLQEMYALFNKVNSKEKVVGWYHTGPKMSTIDLKITESLVGLKTSESSIDVVDCPLLAIINVHLDSYDLPVQIFSLKDGEFVHVSTKIEAEEAEEVGVEHLVRDIKDETGGSLVKRIKEIKESLLMYESVLMELEDYLGNLANSSFNYNDEIINLAQDILNSIPILSKVLDENMAGIYLAELIKSVIALNDLKKNQMEDECLAIPC